MPAQRSVWTHRSMMFVSALLLSTALAAPAFAQIEEVVVTAQKRAEDIQTVPIAVTAFTAQDLQTKQIKNYDDLQYNVPNVTYARSNFGGGADFQIRGIGVTAIGYDAEAGVAINVDNVFLEDPPIANAAFYDISDLEVLAGPQSTLYGRGATGGVVSITTTPPALDEGSASLMVSYGNYNAKEVQGVVDMPLVTDELGIRIAGDWIDHSGYVTNIFNDSHPDNEDAYSMRGSLRWEPSSHTTIDLTASFSKEDDNSMRSTKQLCETDPTGVLGCLPGEATNQPINPNSTFSQIASSKQGMENTYGAGLEGIFGPVVGAALAGELGLFDLTAAPTPVPGFVDPAGARDINTDFNPTYNGEDQFLAGEWKQTHVLSWLDADLVLGYDHDSVLSQESYNNIPGEPINPATLATAEGAFETVAGTLAFLNGINPATYVGHYLPYFSMPGELPISSTQNLGITGGDYSFTPNSEAFDQSNGSAEQYSGELRFDSTFSGPFNFRLGFYDLHEQTTGNYYVNASTLDYPAIVVGALTPPLTDFFAAIHVPGVSPTPLNPAANAACLSVGCILGPSYYDNDGYKNTLTSKSIYGEVYYDVVPDTFKLTLGLRYTEDDKLQIGRIAFLSAYLPIGSNSENNALATAVSQQQINFNAAAPGYNLYEVNSIEFREWTGHLTADWTPKLSFTDQTLVYATYSRGYKAGGFNPGIETSTSEAGQSVPPSYQPEFIDDYELGTKNTLLNGTLQANGDLWYYNYTGLQVSEIENNTSVNNNVNATLWGAEGEFVWAPMEQLAFNLNIAQTHSGLGNTYLVDPRNPTAGDPRAVLIKDDTITASSGENCVLYYTGAGPTPSPATLGISGYTNPNGGAGADASSGIAVANFGPCNPTTAQANALAAAGFVNPLTGMGPLAAQHKFSDGEEENLSGNELQNTPDFNVTIGANWTQPVGGDYNLVAHVDYYWESHMWGRIFEDGSDLIPGWGNMNANLTLNAPDNKWYVQAFIKNVFNQSNIEGEYLTSPTSGLYTNAVYGDPRLYGLKIGLKM